ncbi:acyltransferase family protein [Bizionia sp. KMM 8389]
MKRLPNLDALRFFLAVYVIMIHMSQLSENQNLPNYNDLLGVHKGRQAIAMFFVLSGFLIIRIIYRSKMKGTFSIKKFYMRRILKIFPLYYLVVGLAFFYYHVVFPFMNIPMETNYNLTEGVLLCLFFMANVFVIPNEVGGALGVLWSIAIEEQFYILIAPMLFLLRRHYIFKMLLALTSVYFVIYHLEAFKFLPIYKFDFFFIFAGGLVGILEERKQLEFLKKYKAVPIALVMGVILYFFTGIFDFESVWVYNLFTSVLFAFFIFAISEVNFNIEITNKYLNYFGEISYGLYLYHIFALNIAVYICLIINSQFQVNAYLMLFLINFFTFGLTILIAHLSYKYFETYFLKLKTKYR